MHNNQCNAWSGSRERMKRSCRSFRPALLNGNPGGLCGRHAINSRSVGNSSPSVLGPKLPRMSFNRPLVILSFRMTLTSTRLPIVTAFLVALAAWLGLRFQDQRSSVGVRGEAKVYLGFDRNEYPG